MRRILLKKWVKKLSWMDWIFVGCFFAIIAFFFFLTKREVVEILIRVKVTDDQILLAQPNPRVDYATTFEVGDAEQDNLGRKVVEIMNVDSYFTKPEQKVVYLDLKVKAIYNKNQNQYSMRGRPIIFGQPFSFRFSKVKFDGIVVGFPGDVLSRGEDSWTTVRAQLRWERNYFSDVEGVPPEIAASVKKGDKVFNSQGNVLAEVLNVEIKPAKRTVIASSGQALRVDDPLLKDVYYTLKIKTKKIDQNLYFLDYDPVSLWYVVPLNFPHVTIYPVVTEIITSQPINGQQ
jgi:hypothetical protein